MKSECKCQYFSCESSINKNERFRFCKEDGVITDRININGIEFQSGLMVNDIEHCEIKARVAYQDNQGKHDIKIREDLKDGGSHQTGHRERSMANDKRKGKSHEKHWKKQH